MKSLLCRLCAVPWDTGISLLDPDNGHLADWVVTYVNIQIEQPACPRHICESCSDFISACIQFVDKCRQSQRVFTQPSQESSCNDEYITPCTGFPSEDHISGVDGDSHVTNPTCEAEKSQNVSVGCEQGSGVSVINDLVNYPESSEHAERVSETKENCMEIQEERQDQNHEATEDKFVFHESIVIKEEPLEDDANNFTSNELQFMSQIVAPTFVECEAFPDNEEQSRMDTETCEDSFKYSSICTVVLPKLSLVETAHVCSHCYMFFPVKSELDQHVQDSHLNAEHKKYCREYQCPKCQSKFVHQGTLTWHMKYCQTGLQLPVKSYRNAQNQLVYQCTLCCKESTNKSSLYNHIRAIHTKEKPFKCEICQKTFNDDAKLSRHKSIHFPPTKECPICKTLFKLKSELDYHINSVHFLIKSESRCTICNHMFKYRSDMLRHVRKIHSIKSVMFKCDKCPATFNSKLSHKKHSVTHDENKWKCNICNNVFECETILHLHVQNYHPNTLFHCNMCTFATVHKSNLEQHVNADHTFVTDSYVCDTCGQGFDHKFDLQTHILTLHSITFQSNSNDTSQPNTNDTSQPNSNDTSQPNSNDTSQPNSNDTSQPNSNDTSQPNSNDTSQPHTSYYDKTNKKFICVACDKSFKYKTYLKAHIKRQMHSKSIFQCNKCIYTTHNKCGLQKHMKKVHSTTKFICNVCQAIFKCRPHLYCHMKTTHSDAIFNCTKCVYTTHTKTLLLSHLRKMHKKGPPVPCPLCGKYFRSRNNMTTHKRMVHTTNILTCGLCSFTTKYKFNLTNHMNICNGNK